MAQAPCPPSIIITQAHNARAHTRRKKPNRVFMQNPYRPIIIKFATKVTTFFRLCTRENVIPRSLSSVTCHLFPVTCSRLFHKEYRIPEASKRMVTLRLITAGTFSMPNISAARTLPPMKINTTAKLYFR